MIEDFVLGCKTSYWDTRIRIEIKDFVLGSKASCYQTRLCIVIYIYIHKIDFRAWQAL